MFISESVDIAPRQNVSATEQITLTRCGLEGTGAVLLEPTSGVPPFQFSFDGSPFTGQELYTGLNSQDYTYTVRDAANCEFTNTITVGAEPPLNFKVENVDTTCPDPAPGPMKWGNTIITIPDGLPSNVQGNIQIELVRVRNEADHIATSWEHVYRTYQGIDVTTDNLNADGDFEFKIRMYWDRWFFVRITDDRGCVYTSQYYFHDLPDLPVAYSGRARNPDGSFMDQECANGGPVFDVELNNTSDLVGPFEYILWPRSLEDTDGDGELDVPNGWKQFNDPANPHPDFDAANPINDKVRLMVPRDEMIFGVHYRILVRDKGTGCVRWGNVGQVEPPSPFLNVEVKHRGLTCFAANDGQVEFTVTNHDLSGPVEYRIRDDWRPDVVIQDWTTVPGSGPSITYRVQSPEVNLYHNWWVIEVRDAAGCVVGERFPTIRGNTPLELNLNQVRDASCNFGGQIAVEALGGWFEVNRFNWANNLDRTPWRDYQYAYIPQSEGRTPVEADWTFDSSVVVNPTAFDGAANVYDVYTRDANNCVVQLATPVTINLEAIPSIDSVNIPNTCVITNEQYTVDITTSGGVGALEYIWNGEITTSPSKVLGPGTHTIEIKDENGCSASDTFIIYPRFNAQITTTRKVACDPANDGEITIEVYGGTGDFTFEMITPAGPSNNDGVFGGLSASTLYEFRVTDNISGCIETGFSITLDEPQIPEFEVKTPIENVSCNGANDGKLIILPQAGSNQVDAPYTYSLDGVNFQPSNLFQNLAPGTYTPIVRSKLNCDQTLPSVQITEPAVLTLGDTTVSPFLCTSNNTLGTATITASINDAMGNPTGTAPYLYSFNGASFTANNVLTIPYTNVDQVITIDVRDGANCTDTRTITVPAATKVTVTLNEIQVMNCRDDAIIEVIGTGGSGNYEIVELPSGNIVTNPITIPSGNPGNYVYRLTDLDTGCEGTVNYEILDYETIEANLSKTADASCLGGNDGSIELTLTGYDGNYTYTLYDNANTPLENATVNTSAGVVGFNNLEAGSYYIEIVSEDSPYCQLTTTTVTVQSPALALEVEGEVVTELSCVPGNDAEIIVSATGGWTGYEYQLTNADTGAVVQNFTNNDVFSGLDSGNYMVTVRDINGCTATLDNPITVDAITAIAVNNPPTITPISCIGAADATLSVTATGGQGTAFYSYVLNNVTTGVSSVPQQSNTFTNLVPGRYSITVKDNKGCDDTSTEVDIVDPFEVTITGNIAQEPTCLEDGIIAIEAAGGSGNYEYQYYLLADDNTRGAPSAWVTTTSFELPSGTYEFVARDLNFGCESPVSVIRTLRNVEELTIQWDESAAILNCNGEADAVITAEAFGGIAAYQYELIDTNGQIIRARQDAGLFENLGAGRYYVVAYSDPDCTVNSDLIIITEPDPLQVTIAATEDVGCFGDATGNANLAVTGGTAPYTYTLASEAPKTRTSNLFENLEAGTYTVLVQDSSGCEVEISFDINQPNAPLEAQ